MSVEELDAPNGNTAEDLTVTEVEPDVDEAEDALESEDDAVETDAPAGEGDEAGSAIPEEFVEIARKYKAHEALTDDELDQVADVAIEILRNMLGFFDAGDADIDEYDGDDGELILDVSNADLAILIGRHGKTLEAFQYMFTVLLNNRLGFRCPVVVDIEGYKNRRRQKLESMARNAASKAMQRHTEVRMHPMKPYERRLVHLALSKVNGVTTHSEGSEPNRCVVIVPTKTR